MITNTVSFLKHIFHDCPAKIWEFSARNVRMSEGTFCHVDVHIRLLNDWASQMLYVKSATMKQVCATTSALYQ